MIRGAGAAAAASMHAQHNNEWELNAAMSMYGRPPTCLQPAHACASFRQRGPASVVLACAGKASCGKLLFTAHGAERLQHAASFGAGTKEEPGLDPATGVPAVGECMLVYSRWRPGMPAAPPTHSPSAIRLDDHEGDDLLNFVTFLPEQKLWVHSELAKKRTADDTFVQRRCVRAHAIAL